MSNSSSQSSNHNVSRLAMGDYPSTVTEVKVLPFGDRPVIFTTLKAESGQQITHAVRMGNLDALRIGLNELRTGFPNQLGNLNDDDLISAMHDGVIIGEKVLASVVPQVKKGITVKLDNGETAYNIKLYATEKMTKETLKAALARLKAAAKVEADDDTLAGA